MLNKIHLIGRTGADPETRFMPNGNSVTTARIATTRRWTNKAGEKQEDTEWHRVVFYGRLGEIVQQFAPKGTLLYVEGRLKTSSYEKNGEKRYSTEIIADELQLLGHRPYEESSREPAPAKAKPASNWTELDDDVPF
jgi:single-strand DNA-binding protein